MKGSTPHLANWQNNMIASAQAKGHKPILEDLCQASSGLDERISAYKNNYQQTLINWLSYAHPMVYKLVGEKYFIQLANDYLNSHVLNDQNFKHYGALFSNHLSRILVNRNALKEIPFISDLAKADWLLHQSYYAKNRAPFNIQAFSKLSPEQQSSATLSLAKDFFLIDSHWPLLDLWEFHREVKPIEQVTKSEEKLHFVIVRQVFRPILVKIDSLERSFLQAVIDRIRLRSLSEDIAHLPAKWIEIGWISDYMVR
ncbi:putative DNA-binding domain-containing protein [uncultured Microbulbifer sp.]|uniref:HvfC/BufC family peptide modification chaperone n=1 Tax=uncultured Microbulbifer sp. TaxID=348147 RepID=UPI002625019E|nr:putative DNA-binding domain-containing protein [uncultured Microbulbifer sp.]